MKLGAFVALGPPGGVLALACAELTKVLGGFGDNVLEELKLDAAKWFTWGASGKLLYSGSLGPS